MVPASFQDRFSEFVTAWAATPNACDQAPRRLAGFLAEWRRLPDQQVEATNLEEPATAPRAPVFPQVEALLRDWAALPEARGYDTATLREFLCAWQRLPNAAAEVAPTPRPPPSAIELGTLMEALEPALHRRRQSGQLLNVWEVAGLRRNELRIAGVLAWLLDPRASHGRGRAYLQAILRHIEAREARLGSVWPTGYPTSNLVDQDQDRYRARAESCPTGERTERVDIEINGKSYLLLVEVKVDAPEGPEQLPRYRAAARARAGDRTWGVLFLTRGSERTFTKEERTLHLSWSELARVLESANGRAGTDAHEIIASAIIEQYAKFVRRLT